MAAIALGAPAELIAILMKIKGASTAGWCPSGDRPKSYWQFWQASANVRMRMKERLTFRAGRLARSRRASRKEMIAIGRSL